jgi:hypothetical protein
MDARPITNQRTCPFCHDTLRAEDAVWDCPHCRTTHHSECAYEHGHCAVFACAGERDETTEVPIRSNPGAFVTSVRDDSVIARTRTPELVVAGFLVKALAGFGLGGASVASLGHQPASTLSGVTGTLFPLVVGAALAVSPVREMLRIRDHGYDARRWHLGYLWFLWISMIALAVLGAGSLVYADARFTVACVALLVMIVDELWPR